MTFSMTKLFQPSLSPPFRHHVRWIQLTSSSQKSSPIPLPLFDNKKTFQGTLASLRRETEAYCTQQTDTPGARILERFSFRTTKPEAQESFKLLQPRQWAGKFLHVYTLLTVVAPQHRVWTKKRQVSEEQQMVGWRYSLERLSGGSLSVCLFVCLFLHVCVCVYCTWRWMFFFCFRALPAFLVRTGISV